MKSTIFIKKYDIIDFKKIEYLKCLTADEFVIAGGNILKKKIKVFGFVLGVAVCIAGIYFYWSGAEERATISEIDRKTASEVQSEIDNSFNAKTPQSTMEKYEKYSEGQLIQEVHNMSHQKVYAEQKWGASEITADKVLLLIEEVKSRQFEKESTRDMLLSILQSWAKGNFSNAVREHNQIWKHQNGNVGKATRLLTPKEELKYIEENFR